LLLSSDLAHSLKIVLVLVRFTLDFYRFCLFLLLHDLPRELSLGQ
jgi:hypothetical protein